MLSTKTNLVLFWCNVLITVNYISKIIEEKNKEIEELKKQLKKIKGINLRLVRKDDKYESLRIRKLTRENSTLEKKLADMKKKATTSREKSQRVS